MRLRGFTIFEILIAMVVSSVAVSLSIMIWLNLQKFLNGISDKNNIRTEILLFKNQLREDYFDGMIVTKKSNGFCMNRQEEKIFYSLHEDFITRSTENKVDTFQIHVRNIDYKHILPETELLKEVAIEIQAEGIVLPYMLVMDYDSKTLIKYTRK